MDMIRATVASLAPLLIGHVSMQAGSPAHILSAHLDGTDGTPTP